MCCVNAGLFVVVVNVLVGNACGLGKKAWVVFEVKGTGEETTLL